MSYADFLHAKTAIAGVTGFDVDPDDVNPVLKPHQRDAVVWAVQGGRRALFESFGLGKTLQQLEIERLVLEQVGGGRGLIVCPLGVRQEFVRDAALLDLEPKFIRTIDEASTDGIYLTNYESVRDGKLDPTAFDVVSLDEAAILRGFGGTKTFRELMGLYEGTASYRFVATATPSPNDYIELLAYAAFLDILDVGQAKTRFFKRDSENADNLTLLPHMEHDFWMWIASWALFLQKPSDLGYSDDGYELPPIEVIWHEVPAAARREVKFDRDGRSELFRDAGMGLQAAAAEKRESIEARVAKAREILDDDPDAHCILWHDLEAERRAIAKAVPDAVSVWGSQDLDEREQAIIDFSDGRSQYLSTKPVIAGSGCNFQRHCHRAIFTGIGFKFADFIQAIHRIQRFQQTHPVRIDLIYTEAEREIRKRLEEKWRNHERLVARMSEIIREHGLSHEAIGGGLTRSLGVERQEAAGEGWRLVLNDSVLETQAMDADSVGLIVTSIPFSCYDETTEILTRHGWRTFGELADGDEVATVDPDGQCMEWQRPTDRVWQRYRGEMLHFTGRSFDQMLTPNHRMWVSRRSDPTLRIVRADAVAADYKRGGRIGDGWKVPLVPPNRGEGETPERILIPELPPDIANGHGVQLYWVETEDFMRLAGWYLSEGHADSFETGRSGGRLSIAQQADVNPKNYAEIEDLLGRIGLPPSRHPKQLSVWCRNLAWFLQQHLGHRAANKRIPRWVMELDPALLTILRDTMMKGDGAASGRSYCSISRQLRDDFQELCLRTGWRAHVGGGKAMNLGSDQLCPEIRHAPTRVAYDGMIGCVTVPNGLVVVRRNGKAFVSGNSQYEYSPSFNDFGHNESNAAFWEQMDFLTPELVRVLEPGRVAAIHVKDRIVPGGINKLGFRTLHPFHAEALNHYMGHGLAFLGMVTVVTDVVRENNQTYRLGYTAQCKDGSPMGVGVPEYVLILRKPPTDRSNGYADDPVSKDKAEYSLGRWQVDAHGYWRSNGDRHLTPADLAGLTHQQMFRLFRDHNLEHVYDYEDQVALCDHLREAGKLPVDFMLLQPPSWHPDVWTDVARMRTLNTVQAQRAKEQHLCPLPFDIVSRLIRRWSNEGDLVLDPFAGLGTVPLEAVRLGREGLGVELNPGYFLDSVAHLQAEARKQSMPSLFDALDATDNELAAEAA